MMSKNLVWMKRFYSIVIIVDELRDRNSEGLHRRVQRNCGEFTICVSNVFNVCIQFYRFQVFHCPCEMNRGRVYVWQRFEKAPYNATIRRF